MEISLFEYIKGKGKLKRQSQQESINKSSHFCFSIQIVKEIKKKKYKKSRVCYPAVWTAFDLSTFPK
jgi:hypothetical protein